jgi:type IV pilus assembly protein PilF
MWLTACSTNTKITKPTNTNVIQSINATTINKPAAAEINTRLGIFYLQRNDYKRAKKKLILALQENPNYAPAYSALGYLADKSGEIKQAELYYLKSIRISAGASSMRNNYGIFLCNHKKYQAAIAQFIQAVQNENYLNKAEAYENAGLCAQQIPNPKLAIQYLHKALQYNPNLPNSLIELSKLLFRQKKYNQAKYYLQKFTHLSKPTTESINLNAKITAKYSK